MRKPPPLRPGDTVAVVAPAGAVDPNRLSRGVAILEGTGLRVRVGEHACARYGYLAGRDEERAADFHRAWCDEEIRALFAARGGFGSTRLLPLLDVEVLRAHRKIFVGFSDCTALLNFIVCRLGLVSFHGPVVTSLAADEDLVAPLLAALSQTEPPPIGAPLCIKRGKADGRLLGGCLSVLVALLGTPYEPVWDGAVLFLEDVREAPYRVDRMLTQLKQAGVFERVAALVFGEMWECRASDNEAWSVWDVIRNHVQDYSGPVLGGIPSGHGSNRRVLPLGIRASVEDGTLRFLESPFETDF